MADDATTSTRTTSSNTSKPKAIEFKKRSIVGSASSSFRKRQKQKQLAVRSPSAQTNTNTTAGDGDDDRDGDDDVPATTTDSNHDKNSSNNSSDNEENDDDENDASHSALDAVLATERRRKLLLGRKIRGVDATALSSSSSSTATKRLGVINTNPSAIISSGGGGGSGSDQKSFSDLEGRLMGGRTFAGGRSAGSNDMGGVGGDGDDDGGGGILAMKHKMAMEEFIQKNLREKQQDPLGSTTTTTNAYGGDEVGNHDRQSTERELYAELLLSPKGKGDGIRKRMNYSEDDDGDGDDTKKKRGAEGDVGAGGAVMGGTGIAEVALPIDERLRAARATEMAALERERARMAKRNYHDGTVSSSALPNTVFSSSHSNNTSDLSTNNLLGASYSHNFQLHTKEWVSRRRDERQIEIDALRTAQEATEGNTTIENRARIGFEAARKSAKQGGGSGANASTLTASAGGKNDDPSMRNEWDRKQGGDARSNDERVWRTFMTKQRNRR
jgi:hypothetical protein